MPVGGVAVALLLGTSALLHLPVSGPLLVVGFCGTALIYGADRFFVASPEDEWNHPQRRRWGRTRRRWLLVESVILILVGGAAATFLRRATLVVGTTFAGIAGLHVVTPGTSGRFLNVPGIGKPLLVAVVWAVGGSVFPSLEAGRVVGVSEAAFAAYRLLFILPNVLLLDWADREGDAAAGLRPWGVDTSARTIRWAATALLLGAVGSALGVGLVLESSVLLWVDVWGPVLMIGAVWTVTPGRPGHRLLLDGLVGWPVVTALTAWWLG